MSSILMADLNVFRMEVPTDPLDVDLQRADGCGRIVLSGSEIGTRIEYLCERSPIRVMFPKTTDRPEKEAVIINTAGGIAGGDRLECSVTVLPGASVAVTSQAAEKVYGALRREEAAIVTRLQVQEVCQARLASARNDPFQSSASKQDDRNRPCRRSGVACPRVGCAGSCCTWRGGGRRENNRHLAGEKQRSADLGGQLSHHR